MINRYNYEEFFLLYVDKELDADGQAAVEAFVSQNPDLTKELQLLQQATLADDNIEFERKKILYKEENSICLKNYEEYFLLFADNELNQQQMLEVENFVLKHPQLQNEFTLLQQTKLQPVLISFPEKEELYRSQKKVRRIIPLVLVRMGAAAAIAGIAYVSFIKYFDNKSNDGQKSFAANEQHIAKPGRNDSGVTQKSVTQKYPVQEFAAERAPAQKSPTQKSVVFVKPEKESPGKIKYMAAGKRKQQMKTAQKSEKTQSAEEEVALNKQSDKSETLIGEQNIEIAERNIHQPEPDKNGKNHLDDEKVVSIDQEENMLMVNEPIAKGDKPLITHAVYLETENMEEEKSIYIGSAEINKNKVKGLLKKVTVFLDKKIRGNNNDN